MCKDFSELIIVINQQDTFGHGPRLLAHNHVRSCGGWGVRRSANRASRFVLQAHRNCQTQRSVGISVGDDQRRRAVRIIKQLSGDIEVHNRERRAVAVPRVGVGAPGTLHHGAAARVGAGESPVQFSAPLDRFRLAREELAVRAGGHGANYIGPGTDGKRKTWSIIEVPVRPSLVTRLMVR